MSFLPTEIVSKCINSSGLYSLIGNRIYFVKAKQNPIYPFIVFFIVSNKINNMFGAESDDGQQFDSVKIQFNIHSNNVGSSAEAINIKKVLCSYFDFTILTDLEFNAKIERTNMFGPFWLSDTKEWVYSVEYVTNSFSNG